MVTAMGHKSRTASSSRTSADVNAWFANKQHPQEPLMREVRDVILAADSRITGCIKWQCPTFVFEGNIVSINPQAKSFVSLMFHTGGKIPGSFPQLTGTGATCKYMRIENDDDLRAKQESITEVVRAWCAWKA